VGGGGGGDVAVVGEWGREEVGGWWSVGRGRGGGLWGAGEEC